MRLTARVWPADRIRSDSTWPDLSVSSVRVSDTVITAMLTTLGFDLSSMQVSPVLCPVAGRGPAGARKSGGSGKAVATKGKLTFNEALGFE